MENRRFHLALALVCLAVTSVGVYAATNGGWIGVGIAVLLLVGLIRQVRWGRNMAVAFFWLMLLMGVFAAMPSRVEGDQIMGVESASVAQVVTELVVLCTVALVCLHLLGIYKERFRKGWY